MILFPKFFVPRFALGCLAATPGLALAAPSTWLKIETPEVVVYSDAPATQAIECTVRYIAFRRAFSELFVAPGASLPPSVLLLFRSEKTFHASTPPAKDSHSKVVNYSAEIDGTPLNAFALAGDRDHSLELTFEFETVWALHRLGYAVPIWMSQGAGEVLATLSLEKGQCVVGRFGGHSGDFYFPWPRFFEIGETSRTYSDSGDLARFLDQAWGLMHWVLLKDPASRERFTALALRLRDAAALDAVSAVMDTPADRLSKTINQHLSHAKPRGIPFDESAERARIRATPAPDAEVLVQTSNLLLAGRRVAEADGLLDQARFLAPNLPVVKEALARRMDREGRPDEAVRLYRESIEAGSKNVRAYLQSANARLDDLRTNGRDVAGEGGEPVLASVAELRRALRLDPGSGEAYRLLGRAFFVQPQVSPADIAELSAGVVPGESGPPVRYYRALLYSRLGRTDESHADLRAVIRDPLASDQLRQASRTRLGAELVQADAARIEAFVREKNYGAAREVVKADNPAGEDFAVAMVYDKFASWIDEEEAWAHLDDLSRNERWADLRDAADKFLERFPASKRLPAVDRLIATAREKDAAAKPPGAK